MKRRPEIERFNEAIVIIRREFPRLNIDVNENDPEVDANADIRTQLGLDFDVNINLQNLDELHLNAGILWVSWFPCGDQKVFDSFIQSVIGLLSGTYRIVEYYHDQLPVKALLQRPEGSGWVKVTGSYSLRALIPKRLRNKVLQNSKIENNVTQGK